MKKILGLTSAALLGVVALTGCSCGKDGTYEFKYIEYKDGNETKTTDCKDTSELSAQIAAVCVLAKDAPGFVLDGDQFFIEGQELDAQFYKIEDGKFLFSTEKDGEYFASELLTYNRGKLYYGADDVYLVFEK